MIKKLFSASLLILLVSNTTNLFSYLFQFSMGRLLSVEDFGILSVLNSYSLMFGVILGMLSYVVTKTTIKFRAETCQNNTSIFIFKIIFKYSLGAILLFSFILILFSNELMALANINDRTAYYLLLIYLVSDAFMGMLLGFLQGCREYLDVSIKRSVGSLVRLVLAIILVSLIGGSYNSALFASILGNITVTIWCYLQLKNVLNVEHDGIVIPQGTIKKICRDGIQVTITLSMIAIMVNLDLILANTYLSSHNLGQYSVSSIIAKIAIFFPGVLLPVLFPEVVDKFHRNQSTLNILFVTLSITITMVLIYNVIINFYSSELINFIFGDRYDESSSILSVVTISMSLISISSVFLNYYLAINKAKYTYFLFSIVPFFFMFSGNELIFNLQSLSLYVFYCNVSLIAASLCFFIYGILKGGFNGQQ
ncbi:oligosaccharide flippase family protein [Vibrio cholerae]|uniref:oligosaccharide flippase family protein n=1 Tax=Vibrio cholerae TaxID=666 RepID=UPI00053C43DB|nr:oligosaccharide flippase family protein [Vibrio cholerae]NOE63414.1 oligosaccharide flippase family protein [Vibrio cholerae]BCN21036.1 hypothetical protein [Vibrio cholerae]GHX09791.1 hypothetical protein VCSRO60_2467 [Vibrio cholerae]